MRLQPLRPYSGRVFPERLREHLRDLSVRWGLAHGFPSTFVGEFGTAEADGQSMPLLLRLDRYFDPAGGAEVFAIAWSGDHTISRPPSMLMVWPWMYEAPGPQRKATSSPTSSGSPGRRSGIVFMTASRIGPGRVTSSMR